MHGCVCVVTCGLYRYVDAHALNMRVAQRMCVPECVFMLGHSWGQTLRDLPQPFSLRLPRGELCWAAADPQPDVAWPAITRGGLCPLCPQGVTAHGLAGVEQPAHSSRPPHPCELGNHVTACPVWLLSESRDQGLPAGSASPCTGSPRVPRPGTVCSDQTGTACGRTSGPLDLI